MCVGILGIGNPVLVLHYPEARVEGPDTSKNPVRDFEIPDFRIGFRISKQDFGFHFFDKECENRR